MVKGSVEGEEKIKISSQEKYQDIINIVKGKIEEEKDTYLVKGSKGTDIDNFVMRVSSGLSQKVKGDDKLKSKLLNQKLPEKIKSSFFDFAKKLNKEMSEISEQELDQFRDIVVPDIVNEVVEFDENPTLNFLSSAGATEIQNFFKDFKEGVSQGIIENFESENPEVALDNIAKENDIIKVKEVVKESLQKSLKSHFHLEEKKDVSEDEEKLIVKTLATTLKEDESKIKHVFSKTKEEIEKEKQDKETLLFKESGSVKADPRLEGKLRAAENENLQLKKQIEHLKNEVKTSKETIQKVQTIAQSSIAEASAKS